MLISFGRKGKVPMNRATDLLTAQNNQLPLDIQLTGLYRGLESKAPSRLVDLRSAENFRTGFIPGSFSVPDLDGVEAARRSGLFSDREIYLLADDPEQLQLCSEWGDLGEGSELAGWFGPDALEEWRRAGLEISSIEAVSADTLAIRLAAWNTLVLDISEEIARPPTHPSALNFHLRDLPLSLDGLPLETPVCLTAATTGSVSFSASLLWNFGFHKISYLSVTENVKKLSGY